MLLYRDILQRLELITKSLNFDDICAYKLSTKNGYVSIFRS